ncbi:peptidyl-dipeptidase A [Marininema mesophilum]|uniref:Peptidyl-dipeptidase A n=1 Tax=Marininema mesophilum TaxID=1048340 RepID=A0A1H2RVA7_9BACL|nr:M2 family metallopeptidase [Marininema mesophilum]SDW23188.1 peptidyl-dipeptidase A [Marininema mesophilum]
MEMKAEQLITKLTAQIRDVEKQMAEAWWLVATTGEKKHKHTYAKHLTHLKEILSDPDTYRELGEMKGREISDPLLARQLEILSLQFMGNQASKEDIAEIVRLETEIESDFINFRAGDQERKVSDNELRELYRTERDTYRRKEIWKASKQVGQVVAEKILELVRKRNEIARKQGLRDYYQMSLQRQEIDETELFDLLADLKQQTDQPFSECKKELDQIIADRYVYLRPEGLRPWHYEDPFFQEAPVVFDVDLDGMFADKKLEEIAERTFQGIGFDVKDIYKRSDLYERDGKSQHAFCIDVDREGDTRILCNLRPDTYWMSVLLHELGHAVFDTCHDSELPYLLRKPAHDSSTEAVAILMESLSQNPMWLSRRVGVDATTFDKITEPLAKQTKLSMLIFVRWCLVMIHFERALYADPEQDLNRLWWDFVEEFQFLPRPEGRNEPDWAAKIHLGTSPVYYQNYLLGKLTASQILAAMEREFPTKEHPLVDNEDAGYFLRECIFRPGARYRWNELLERATGEKLSARHFVAQFVEDSPESKAETEEEASKK